MGELKLDAGLDLDGNSSRLCFDTFLLSVMTLTLSTMRRCFWRRRQRTKVLQSVPLKDWILRQKTDDFQIIVELENLECAHDSDLPLPIVGPISPH